MHKIEVLWGRECTLCKEQRMIFDSQLNIAPLQGWKERKLERENICSSWLHGNCSNFEMMGKKLDIAIEA